MEYKHRKRRQAIAAADGAPNAPDDAAMDATSAGHTAPLRPPGQRPGSAGKQRTASAGKRRVLSAGKQRASSAGKQRATNSSAGRQRTSSSGKRRTAATSAGRQRPADKDKDGPRKGWGGLLRRKKASKKRPTQDREEAENVCDFCQRLVHGKTRDEMYRLSDYVYCSTDCTRRHQQALDAEGEAAVAQQASKAIGYVEDGIASPPITPSAALLNQQHRGERSEASNQRHGQRDSAGKKKHHAFGHNWFNNDGDDAIDNPLSNCNELHYQHNGFSDVGNSWSRNPQDKDPTPARIRIDYGRGVSDEYRDYNDELSRQLRLAARQDELESEERKYQKRQFINAHCNTSWVKDSSPGRYSNVSSICEGSPGRHSRYLRGVGANVGNTNAGGKPAMAAGGKRKKYPVMKQNENSTQSTESVSSSSHGGMSPNVGNISPLLESGSLNASPQPTATSIRSNNSSRYSWGYLDVSDMRNASKNNTDGNEVSGILQSFNDNDVNDSWATCSKNSTDEMDRAFKGLGDWPEESFAGEEWPSGLVAEDKVSRAKNLPAKEGVGGDGNVNKDNDGAGDDNWKLGDKKAKGIHERLVSNLSAVSDRSPPPSALERISEEQSPGATEDDEGRQPLSGGLHYLAQKVGLRAVKKGDAASDDAVDYRRTGLKHKKGYRQVDEVVSTGTDYDDPSIGMLSSLATNDTVTTKSGSRSPMLSKGRGGPPPVKQMVGANSADVGQRQQRNCDPPGESIDELLKQGIRGGYYGQHYHSLRGGYIYRGRDPSFQGLDPSVNTDPSFHNMGSDRGQYQRHIQHRVGTGYSPPRPQPGHRTRQHGPRVTFSPEGRVLDTIEFHPRQPRRQGQRQQDQRRYPQQQQQEQAYYGQVAAGQSPGTETPPQLRPPPLSARQQELQWSSGPRRRLFGEEQAHGVANQEADRPGQAWFDVGNIEFPTHDETEGQANGDDTSMGMLTGEDDELPLPNGDDDTATSTMDTVDLVAEVKRVWRHVQRYETKKHRKKQLKKQYGISGIKNSNPVVDASGLTTSLAKVHEVKMITMEEDAEKKNVDSQIMMMESLMQQYNELQVEQLDAQTRQQHQRQHQRQDPTTTNDGDSKLSDITQSSSHKFSNVTTSRGRSSERMGQTLDGNVHLGTQMRSTLTHSHTHTPVQGSPGMDSNFAMADSHASTERDAVFLSEGVDGFYDSYHDEQLYQNSQARLGNRNHRRGMVKDQQRIEQTLDKLHRSSPSTIQQYSESSSHSNIVGEEEEIEEEQGDPNQHPSSFLSKPYDITKTKSAGTSFTQKTQKISNTSTAPPSLWAEMARKYQAGKRENHRRHPHPTPATPLQQDRYPQQQEQRQHHLNQRNIASVSGLYSKALQNTREQRIQHKTNKTNRVS